MPFWKKHKEIKCNNCKSIVEKKFNFCPYCGQSTMDEQAERKEFGLLGKDDFSKPRETQNNNPLAGMGITDKVINSLMNNLMKSMESQFRNMPELESENNARIEQTPNGIKIKIGIPFQEAREKKPKQKRREITQEQLDKMSKLPRVEAKTKIKRLSDKVVYEIAAPGIESPDDVFISKLENGYEIKAIGKKKVYVNSLPISLPVRGYSFDNKTLLVEFKLEK